MSFEPDDPRTPPGSAPAGAGSRGTRARLLPVLPVALGLALGAAVPHVALGAGEVSEVLVEERPATPFRYSVDGRTYTWGLGTNQTMRGFVAAGRGYGYTDTVTRVELRRDDVASVAEGNPCGVFVERLDEAGDSLAADYPSDGSGTGGCDMAELLASRTVNRGALDLFSNVLPDAKNIERVDFAFDHGVLAPFAPGARALAGHLVGEKRGNNAVRIAAILALDVFGQPAEYGPLVQIDSKHDCTPVRPCYGETDLVHEYAFFQNETLAPHGFPSETERSVETVAMAFVDLERLGLHPGQRYFGFSLFADDVDRNVHVLTDPATFPDDTADDHIAPGDGADIYGGLAGYFVADELAVATGRVYLDEDDDGAFGEGDAGISDIGITLYADTNGDGAFDPLADVALADPIDSDARGLFHLPGLADGGYFVVLHEGDPELPGGLEIVPGVNPQALFVSGADVDGVDFPFSNGDGPTGGTTGADGGGTGGTADGGGDGATGTDDGGTDTAGTDGGGAGDGGADDGGADGDGATGGGTGGGTGDDGGADDGGSDDGGADGDGGTGDDGGTDDGGTGDGGTDGDGVTGGGGTGDDGGATDSGAGGGADDGGATGGGAGGGAGGDGDGDGGGGGGADGGGTGDGGADGDGATGGGTGDDGGADGGGADDGGASDGGTGDGGTGDGGATGGGTDGGGLEPDDSSTSAVADSASTEQGKPVSIDVLLNDTDAAGGGLEIVSVSDSPDADIAIVDGPNGRQEILYTPDFGFFGTDTFMYTITDTAGVEATGTVAVTVVRFSDINGNGLNDFVECDCTDLTLETGVHGSGIGRVGAVSLAGLAAWLLLAAARRSGASRRRGSGS